MNGTVLVAVTGAVAAGRAAEWAARRASELRERVTLISVVGGESGVAGEESVIVNALKDTQRLLEECAGRVRAHQVECATRIVRGRPLEKLIAASQDADLLVIGSDSRIGLHGPDRGVLGMRIAAGAHCPVVVVPDIDLDDRVGVIIGVDPSQTSDAPLRFAAIEAARTHEPLTAISTWSPVVVPVVVKTYPGAYLQNMQTLTEEALAIALAGLRSDYPDLTVRRIVERGYPEAIIHRYSANARLVVIGSHGRGAVARFLLGSTSEAVLARLITATAVVR